MLEHIKKNGTAIYTCPTANANTQRVAIYKGHPFHVWVSRGIDASLHADDFYWGDVRTTLSDDITKMMLTAPQDATIYLTPGLARELSQSKRASPYAAQLTSRFVLAGAQIPVDASVVYYFDKAKGDSGLDYVLVEKTSTGKLAEWNYETKKINILTEFARRAPAYIEDSTLTRVFQELVNDIFRHEAVHAAGDASEDNAIAASLAYFRRNSSEIVSLHNWLFRFGVELDGNYMTQIKKLEEELSLSLNSVLQGYMHQGKIAWSEFEDRLSEFRTHDISVEYKPRLQGFFIFLAEKTVSLSRQLSASVPSYRAVGGWKSFQEQLGGFA